MNPAIEAHTHMPDEALMALIEDEIAYEKERIARIAEVQGCVVESYRLHRLKSALEALRR